MFPSRKVERANDSFLNLKPNGVLQTKMSFTCYQHKFHYKHPENAVP